MSKPESGGRPAVRVDVHPWFTPSYAAYGFQGLADAPQRFRIEYTTDGFPDVGEDADLWLLRVHEPYDLHVAVSMIDRAAIHSGALEWCDVFGKVNLDLALVPETHRGRVLATGPTFGIRAWPLARAAVEQARTKLASRFARHPAQGNGFWAQWRSRLPIDAYTYRPGDGDFIFFAAWPWKKHPSVNPPRADFVRACRERSDIVFEGGFAPRRRNDMPEYNDVLAPRRYPLRDYLTNTKRSALVFNTPAVHDCLGWKLGEYLALGKAIVSLPITRELPAPLVHGESVHFVDGSRRSIQDAIDRIIGDGEYRAHLERNARRYYETWLRPDRLIGRLLDAPRASDSTG